MASITGPVFNSCLERHLNPTTDHEYENERAKSDDWRRLSNEFEKGASGYQELQISRERVYQPLASRNSTELVIRPASNEEYVVQPSEVRFQLGEKHASAKPGSAQNGNYCTAGKVGERRSTGSDELEDDNSGYDDVQTNGENNYPELVSPKPTEIVSRPSSKQDHAVQPPAALLSVKDKPALPQYDDHCTSEEVGYQRSGRNEQEEEDIGYDDVQTNRENSYLELVSTESSELVSKSGGNHRDHIVGHSAVSLMSFRSDGRSTAEEVHVESPVEQHDSLPNLCFGQRRKCSLKCLLLALFLVLVQSLLLVLVILFVTGNIGPQLVIKQQGESPRVGTPGKL